MEIARLSNLRGCPQEREACKSSLFTEETNLTRKIYDTVEVVLNSSTPLSNDVNTAIIYQYIAIRVTLIVIV